MPLDGPPESLTVDESRTVASLLWRIDHGQAHLTRRMVVVCDEEGMTDDPNMLRHGGSAPPNAGRGAGGCRW